MKKIVIRIFKVLGIILLAIILLAGGVYYKSVNYNMYDLQADKELLAEPSNEEGYAKLAEDLVSQMTLKEKIAWLPVKKVWQIPK